MTKEPDVKPSEVVETRIKYIEGRYMCGEVPGVCISYLTEKCPTCRHRINRIEYDAYDPIPGEE